MSEDIEKAYDDLYERGLTDGLPIIPPTKERIKRMLEFTDKKPDDSLGTVPPNEYEATVESVAANSVMAGCKPEYFPVVVTMVEAMLDRPNLRASLEPHRCNPLIICNGPIAKEIGISTGWDIGPTSFENSPNKRPNITIGRALLLSLYNIAFGKPVEHFSAFGTCFAENEELTPWESFHVERGFSKETSTVTVKNEASLRSLALPGSRPSGDFFIDLRAWAKGIIPDTAHGIASPTGGSTSVIIMTPGMAKNFAANGMSKDDIRRFLYETCRMNWKEWYPEYPAESRESILKTAFATSPVWMRYVDLVPLFPNYGKDIHIVVAGPQPVGYGPSGCLGDHGHDPVVTKPIMFNGAPAKSVFDFKQRK
jgi:hypothetical protein